MIAEIISLTIYVGIALALALGMLSAGAITLHWGKQRDTGVLPYIFYPVLIVALLGVTFSGRNLYQPQDILAATAAKSTWFVWATRLTSVFILLAAIERIAHRYVTKKNSSDKSASLLSFGLWVYFLSNVLSSALFGAMPSLSHEYFYALFAAWAAVLFSAEEGEYALKSARNALFFLLVASALFIPIKPELVLSRDYQGLIPGLSLRYAGLTNHPNALGPLATVFLLCLWLRPFKSTALSRFSWALGLGSLLLTQSKTSWISFLVCALCIAYFRHGSEIRRYTANPRHAAIPQALLLFVMLGFALVCVWLMFGSLEGKVAKYLNTREGADLLSLTGRNLIWNVAIQEWQRSPVFGAGLQLWTDSFRMQIGLSGAVHAHSQFFQSLSTAGVVGVMGLIFYAMVLLKCALMTARASEGFAPALYVLLLIRSVSEVPMSMIGYGTEQLTHLLLLMVIAANLSKNKSNVMASPATVGAVISIKYR